MTVNRFSTDIIKRQGARQKAVEVHGRIVNVFQASLGGDNANEAANKLLGNTGLVPSEVNVESYHVAKSFYNRRTDSEPAAIALALASLDAAKVSGISISKFLDHLSNDEEIVFDLKTILTLNVLRPTTSKTSLMRKNTNTNSLRSRTILP